jgi:hypothetical protein
VSWIVVAYIGCGLIAWSRRPESRFGPLMVAAGFVPALSRLAEANAPVLHVIGESLLLLPPLVFIHVFLAYPSGRLVRRFDRIVVITGYSAFFGLDLVRLVCEATGRSGDIALRAQRTAIGIVGLAAVVALVSRRKASGRPVRLSLEFLVAVSALRWWRWSRQPSCCPSRRLEGTKSAGSRSPCWASRL